MKRYQWVGLLAGVPLFSGSWLSAIYNNVWWGVAGALMAAAGCYVANHVERKADARRHFLRGFTAGLLAGVVARLLGYVAWQWAGVSATAAASSRNLFRVVIAGGWWANIALVIVCAVAGGIIAANLETEAGEGK